MQEKMKITDAISVGGQPTEETIEVLASEGFKSVVNFRADGEEEQQLSPETEETLVRKSGMNYVHFPVTMQTMSATSVDKFRKILAQLETPVFAHCKSGKRAGAMVMIDNAVKAGMTGDQVLQMADQMGFQCDVPQLKDFVKGYVDAQTGEKTRG